MNTLKSIATKFVTAVVATGLVAGAAFAAPGSTVSVTLPQAVTVGNATLASGAYQVTEFSLIDGSSMFVFRSEKGSTTSAIAMKNADPVFAQKTELILSNSGGGTMHLDKMFIEGDSAGYRFAK